MNISNLIARIKKIFTPLTYSEELERYIVSKSPVDVGDVERLTLEWDRKNASGGWIV